MTKAEIRAASIGAAKKFKSKVVDCGDFKAEVRQPTIRARGNIFRRAKAQSGDQDKLDMAELLVTAVIECSFVPGTDERVFEEGDRESLHEMPAGSWVDELSAVAFELLNVKQEEIEKNSERTPSAS